MEALDGAIAGTNTSGLVEWYRDQSIGVADASLLVLADRYSTKRILTLDRRPVDVLRPLSGGRFSTVGA